MHLWQIAFIALTVVSIWYSWRLGYVASAEDRRMGKHKVTRLGNKWVWIK